MLIPKATPPFHIATICCKLGDLLTRDEVTVTPSALVVPVRYLPLRQPIAIDCRRQA